MGNCVSFDLSCDQTINGLIRCLIGKGYIRNLKKNLRALKWEMEDLIAIQHDVKNKIAREEKQNRQRLEVVQVWLTRVESIDTRVNDILATSPVEFQNLCLCGLCSRNVCSSYNYGKRVFLLLGKVRKLKLEGDFELVTELTPRYSVEERPTRPTVGQELMLEKAWNHLMKDGVGIMGLQGMGGVGKTTLFKKIHNKFAKMINRFDVVLWVVVSQSVDISMLQEAIAQKLHLCGDEWTNKTQSDKATKMHEYLKGKRFVLMLDDIWEKVDLEAIGIPFPTIENGCKVAFTTRSREICGRMGDHEPMQVNCLEWNEAWELFKNKIGDKILRRDPIIEDLAKKVAEKCSGLPLALNVIGETMASKSTIQEWEYALEVLIRSASEFPDVENKILAILKFSYDNLVGEDIKSCFLYCALFPEDGHIYKESLIDYWICEGFIRDCRFIKRAKNKGHEILGSLIRVNLLMEANDKESIVMHDVVREMALWISTNFGKYKDIFVVKPGVGLIEIPKVKDWKVVRRMSLMDNKIEEITCRSNCSELKTMFLQGNNLKSLSGEFIRSMQKLVVLDLSYNRNFNKLPEQISELISLQYLDLAFTRIEQLPIGFQELKNLTQLNLTGTKRLCNINGISKLSRLRVLNLWKSNVQGDVSLFRELKLLEYLQFLTIMVSTKLGLEQISFEQRLANCIDSLEICNFQQKPLDLSLMEHLRVLRINNCHVMEINTYTKSRETSHFYSPATNPCFTNISHVAIHMCNSIKDLTWLMLAPNLVSLYIQDSEEVKEIINEEKTTNLTYLITPFQRLERLSLENLPKLESI